MKFIMGLTHADTLKSAAKRGVILILALAILSCGAGLIHNNCAAASPGEASNSSQNPKLNLLPKAIATAVLRDAAKHSGIPIRNLQIIQVTAKTFSNPCVFNFNEICTQEYNPVEGWEVIIPVRKQSWKYHVNKSGTQILLDPTLSKTRKN